MTDYVQRFSGLVLFLFCSCILVVSLFTTNRVTTGQHMRLPTTRIYLSNQILPDNLLYLPLMLRDRLVLNFTPYHQQVFTKLEYSEERSRSAHQLLENGQEALAVTTMSKSQKYLLQAVYQMRSSSDQYTLEEKRQIRAALDHSLYRLESFYSRLTMEAPALDALQAESQVLLEQIDSV